LAAERGASIINDISGGDLDPRMLETVAGLRLPYIAMHMQGVPATMQKDPHYDDVVVQVFDSLRQKMQTARAAGITDIILDVGFGFGKTTSHNFTLLRHLSDFRTLGCPLLAGISRKGMVWRTLGTSPEDALNGTTALHMAALMNGASILRVHDVKEAMETIRLYQHYAKA
jgi:dihydropteroate synthase